MPKIKRNGKNKKNYNPEEFAKKLEKRTKKFAIKIKRIYSFRQATLGSQN